MVRHFVNYAVNLSRVPILVDWCRLPRHGVARPVRPVTYLPGSVGAPCKVPTCPVRMHTCGTLTDLARPPKWLHNDTIIQPVL